MTNEIVKKSFVFNSTQIRTAIIDGEPWFVAKDVCEVLGIVDNTTAVRDLENDELTRILCVSGGQRREVNAVSESGLYALIFKSRKSEAKAFRKWVASEVLPALRNKSIINLNTFKENIMENLPVNHSVNRTMSSREIAELTGKEHKNVLRDIENLIDQGAIDRLKFEPISYRDSYGREQPEYRLDFKATMTLVTGYNAVLRSRVIDRWYELEQGIHSTQRSSFQSLHPSEDTIILAHQFEGAKKLAELFGLEGNQALLKADKAVKKLHNISPMALLEIELKSPDNEALLIATEIGKRLNPPLSAKNVNLLLADMKLQEKVEYRAGKFEWRLTEKGKAYGSYLDTGKTHSNGTPIQQIKWKESILPLVQKHSDSI